MQAYTLGIRPKGKLEYIPAKMLSESAVGQLYEIHVRTQSLLGRGGTSKDDIAGILMRELPKRVPGLKVKWISIEDTMIKIVVEGSPFLWLVVLEALPAILSLVGVAVALIGIYMVWSAIPSWTLGLLIVAMVLIYLAPKLGGLGLESLKGLEK